MRNNHFLLTLFFISFLLGLWFDIRISDFFFDAETGKFPAKEWLWVKFLHEGTYVYATLVSIFLLALLAGQYFFKKTLFNLRKIQVIYLILVLILGPGILVNVLAKNNGFGRARPIQTEMFGGEKQFTPAFAIADQCETNCAFVSGHAATGFYSFAFAFVARERWRRRWIALTLIAGSAVSASRILQGAHYFSDVLFAALLIYLLSACMEKLFLRFFAKGREQISE
jgi:lipid A 4'-phosphatase